MIEPLVPGLVTVIVASYNHARFLERRMDSLLRQTYAKLEILVIDDRSPDNSVQILRRYESDPRVKLIAREQNGGWVAVSNQGVDLAHGEFLLFGNCDDACDPRMIERLVAAARANPDAGITWCRSLMVDAEDRAHGDDRAIQTREFQQRCVNDTVLSGPEMSRVLLKGCVISNLSAALFRTTMLREIGPLTTEFRACSDWELFFRMARAHSMSYVAEPLNFFRQHPTTIRNHMKERETYQEYFRLLFGEARGLHLTFAERASFRLHMMFLWAVHIFAPSPRGFLNFRYHLELVWKYDAVALWFLPAGLALRTTDLLGKIVRGRRASPEGVQR